MKSLPVKFSWLLAVVFLLIGILGFFPNSLFGEEALFHADTMHNVVHLLTGLIALIVAMNGTQASVLFLRIFGVVYLLVAVLGFLMIGTGEYVKLFGLAEVNAADNWLHLVLGVIILWVGMTSGSEAKMKM